MVYSGNQIFPGSQVNRPAAYNNEAWVVAPGLVAVEYVGRAAISTAAASWAIQDRAGNNPVIPIGAQIYRLDLILPAGIVATTGNLLKVAATLAEAASSNNLLSAAAASSTYAASNATKSTGFPGGTALGSPLTLQLFSTDGTGTAAGANASAPAGTTLNPYIRVCYTMPAPYLNVDDYRARFGSRGNVLNVSGTASRVL